MFPAIQSVMSGQLSICKAAVEFNVPKSSLGHHIHRRLQHGKKNGPDMLVTPTDKAKLAAYLVDVSKQGYGKSKEIIIFMATQMATKRGKEVKGHCLSDKWWQHFLKGHPDVSMRSTENFRTSFYRRLLEMMTHNNYGSLL